MESWHSSTEIKKYLTVRKIIESNDWCVEVFAVEVGDRGYWCKLFWCCFKKLGLNNNLIRKTIVKLRHFSMECSFSISLARNNKKQTPSAAICKIPSAAICKMNGSWIETSNSWSSMSFLKQTTKPVSNARSISPAGFVNKGNACYANFILLILSAMRTLWNRVPSDWNTVLSLLQAISLTQHDWKKEFHQDC